MVKRELLRGGTLEEMKDAGPQFEERQILFIDVDSTLCGIEGIDELAEFCGVGETVSEMTRAAMGGNVPFEEVFKARLELIQPHRTDLDKVTDRYRETIVPDAKQTIDILQKMGKRVFLISGGYTEAIEPVAHDLGIPKERVLANTLYFDYQGNYAGFDEENPLCQAGGKGKVIERLEREGACYGKTLLVGDGASEVEALEDVDLVVGFGGFVTRERVKRDADVFLGEQTLTPLIPLMLGYDRCLRLAFEQNEVDRIVDAGIDRMKTLQYHLRSWRLEAQIGALLHQKDVGERFGIS